MHFFRRSAATVEPPETDRWRLGNSAIDSFSSKKVHHLLLLYCILLQGPRNVSFKAEFRYRQFPFTKVSTLF